MLVGVFDSGIGGLTVLREVRRQCAGHSTIYLGDTARVPYGAKSADTVRRYALTIADFLLREGAETIVVACNTATAFALDALRELPVPVIGVIEPGAEAAVARSAGRPIGVLGTAGTVRSGAYREAIRALAPEVRVRSIACPLFVPLVEEGWTSGPIARAVAERYLEPWLPDDANRAVLRSDPGAEERPGAVILGCTHYPLLGPLLSEVLGPDVDLVDSARTVAARVRASLAARPDESSPTHRLLLTDASDVFAGMARRLSGALDDDLPPPPIELVDLDPAQR